VVHTLSRARPCCTWSSRRAAKQVWLSARDDNKVVIYDTATFAKIGEFAARRRAASSSPAAPRASASDGKALDRRSSSAAQRLPARFPALPAPFAELASRLGVAEGTVLRMLEGPAPRGQDLPRRRGLCAQAHRRQTLAAMAVPPEKLAAVAEAVNRFPEVNHNYEREHRYNLWFVVTPVPKAACRRPRGHRAGRRLAVAALPLLQELPHRPRFLRSSGARSGCRRPVRPAFRPPRPLDEPSAGWSWPCRKGCRCSSGPLRSSPTRRLRRERGARTHRRWCEEGIIKRFGVVVRHHELGYTANAMLVHDIPDERGRARSAALAASRG
jgi:DNA-binding Lrp family transcriptional regulator